MTEWIQQGDQNNILCGWNSNHSGKWKRLPEIGVLLSFNAAKILLGSISKQNKDTLNIRSSGSSDIKSSQRTNCQSEEGA